MDYTAAATAITGVIASAAPVMTAIVGVVAAFFGFRKVLSLIGR
jgi:hypothetical protein